LSFDIGIQSLDYQGQHYATDPDAKFEFKIASFSAADFAAPNVMQHFEVDIAGSDYLAGNTHTLELVDATSDASFTGFSVDSIEIHDWVV
jgi:hypothetical protein